MNVYGMERQLELGPTELPAMATIINPSIKRCFHQICFYKYNFEKK